jgi:hypothetical protein
LSRICGDDNLLERRRQLDRLRIDRSNRNPRFAN